MWAAVGSGGHMATTLQCNAVTVLLQPQVTNPINVYLSVPTIHFVQQNFLVILSEICIDQKIAKEFSTPQTMSQDEIQNQLEG